MSTATAGALRLTEVRARAAAALAPRSDEDPELYPDLVDAVGSLPAILLFYADPWLDRNTVGGRTMGGTGLWDCWLEVLLVAGRADPSPSLAVLEDLVGYVMRRFLEDDYSWPVETFYSPRNFRIGDVTYLGARMVFRLPVTV